jgi:hypothetical protein
MIISSEIENVEKVENLIKAAGKSKSDQKIDKVKNLTIYFYDCFIRNPI